jgi:hypothetical protein
MKVELTSGYSIKPLAASYCRKTAQPAALLLCSCRWLNPTRIALHRKYGDTDRAQREQNDEDRGYDAR